MLVPAEIAQLCAELSLSPTELDHEEARRTLWHAARAIHSLEQALAQWRKGYVVADLQAEVATAALEIANAKLAKLDPARPWWAQ